jgi:hypothetical protein
MTYNVRTSNGASITNNGPDELISKWGCLVGQGAGDNPALSTDISSPLFNSRRDENLGFEFIISVIAKTHRKLAGLGFMDDTNGKMDTGNMRGKTMFWVLHSSVTTTKHHGTPGTLGVVHCATGDETG